MNTNFMEGPELDILVAKAVGFHHCERGWYTKDDYKYFPIFIIFDDEFYGVVIYLTPGAIGKRFRPSIDLNDAWFAGEQIGLFHQYRFEKHANGKYSFCALCSGDDGWSRFHENKPDFDTPMIAICESILTFKRNV